jgi:hypothetical protein
MSMADEPTAVEQAALKFEAIKLKMTQDKNGYVLTLSVHPADVPDDLFRAWVGARYAVAMVQLDDEDQPVATAASTAGNKAMQSAGILCHDPRFQEWFGSETGELVLDEKTCAEELRKVLGIMSRSEIGRDKDVRSAFLDLRDKYYKETSNAPAPKA